MENTDNNDKYILHSVESALTIMDLFFKYEYLTPTDVSKYLNMNRSTAHRTLVTLENSGYLTKDENSRYHLGVKVSTLGQIAHNRMALINLIHPELNKISEKTGESCHLVIMDNPTHVTFIDKSVGTLWLKMDILLGYTQYAHLTATGKAILAWESEQFLNNYIRSVSFEKYTQNSIRDARELLETLDEIRKNGYSRDREEVEIGLSCLAVPILSASGQPIAAISISGPTTRIEANSDSLIGLLHEKAEKICKSL